MVTGLLLTWPISTEVRVLLGLCVCANNPASCHPIPPVHKASDKKSQGEGVACLELNDDLMAVLGLEANSPNLWPKALSSWLLPRLSLCLCRAQNKASNEG